MTNITNSVAVTNHNICFLHSRSVESADFETLTADSGMIGHIKTKLGLQSLKIEEIDIKVWTAKRYPS